MLRRLWTMIAASVLFCGPVLSGARAASAWMQEAQIRAELVGKQLSGIYPGGLHWRELIAADGSSDYREAGRAHPGRWTVKGELFCFAYPVPQMGGCFRIVKRSANCYEMYTASYGATVPAQPPPASTMAWNGRMWRDATRATCDEKAIS